MATASESAQARDEAEQPTSTLYRLAVAYVAAQAAAGAVPSPPDVVPNELARDTILMAAALKLARSLFRSTPSRYGSDLPEDLPGASVDERAQALATDLAKTAVTQATEHYSTVADRVRRGDPEATTEDIAKEFTADTPWQKAAARTAATRQSAETALSMVGDVEKASGLAHRVLWISRGDTKVRHSHRQLHGKTRAPGKSFKMWPDGQKLAFPGDPRAPLDEIINCRCSLLLVPESTAHGAADTFRVTDEDFDLVASIRLPDRAELDLFVELDRLASR